MPEYKCLLCDTHADPQKSHHVKHCKTKKHKDKKRIKELELNAMTTEQRVEKYKKDNVNEIINELETHIIDIDNEITKKKISGQVIWNVDDNMDSNDNYKQLKAELDTLIKKCHNLLYRKAVVGSKAQNDIMRILCIKILQEQFNDENSAVYKKCNEIRENTINKNKFDERINYCKNISSITTTNAELTFEWKQFVNSILIELFPSIYFKQDNTFNCEDKNTIIELIRMIDSINITGDFKDAFATNCGDIHELFRAYSGGKAAKDLGQFFTPRNFIHIIFYGCGLDILLESMDNISVYDPCMGTGGFLTRIFNMCNIESNNIYGCETEIDTIKFGEMSMLLTTGNTNANIVKCDSLCENPFIQNKKVKCIVTNPPFGTKMDYKSLKKNYEENFPERNCEFEDIYPLPTNNGASLFVQHCVFMLQEGGVCTVVLPDGELFEGNSQWSKKFRKWLCQTVNIRTILKAPSGVFEHAGVKTNVVIFTKDGPTQSIRFLETNKECNEVRDMFSVTMDELVATKFSLDVGEYIEDVSENYDVPMVALGDILIDNVTSNVINPTDNNPGEYEYYSCSENKSTSDTYYYEGEFIIQGSRGSIIKALFYTNNKFSLSGNMIISQKKNNKVHLKYVYQFMKFNRNKLNIKGGGPPMISKENYYKIKIPLPSLEVQQQIVDELTLVEESTTTIQTRLDQLKREKEQYRKYGKKAEIRALLEGSESKMLGDICELVKGKQSSNDFKKLNIGTYPVISKAKYEKNFTYIENYDTEGENVFICDTFAGDGKGDLTIHYYNGRCNYTNLIHKIDVPDNLNTKYLYYILTSDMTIFNSKFQNGSSKPTLDKTKLKKNFKIPLPSLEIQEQCITLFEQKEAYIESIDKKIAEHKNYLEELKALAKDVITSFC